MKVKNLKHLFHILDNFGNLSFFFILLKFFLQKSRGFFDQIFFSQNGENLPQNKIH
jgi:hypothetical protein